MKQIKQIYDFQQRYQRQIGVYGQKPTEKTFDLRVQLIAEELGELWLAYEKEPVINCYKELIDLMYVVFGAAADFGLHPDLVEQIFDEVHKSNMSKGTNGEPVFNEAGKVLKGDDYTPADLSFLKV
jgi:predicted HAD superfamily Cof-like phosphohydrolase